MKFYRIEARNKINHISENCWHCRVESCLELFDFIFKFTFSFFRECANAISFSDSQPVERDASLGGASKLKILAGTINIFFMSLWVQDGTHNKKI